jgi:hypothetical protein
VALAGTALNDPAREAARSAAYRLLASLWLDGATPDLLATLREVPELGEALPDPFDADLAAAEHHRLLGLQVPPYAGVFLDDEGQIGGAPAALVLALHGRAGLPAPLAGEEADHVGHALTLLARLSGRPELEAETLDRALLPWLPWLVEVVERHGGPFHRTVAALTLELALDHRRGLVLPPALDPPLAHGGPDPVHEPSAGLRDVAAFLVAPARSGLYIARDDVRRMAAADRLPTGFGGRADALETLLRAAAEYGALQGVVDGLAALMQAGAERCAALEATGLPTAVAVAAARRSRLSGAATVVASLAEVAGAG